MAFSSATVGGTFPGNGTEVKADKRSWTRCCSWDRGNARSGSNDRGGGGGPVPLENTGHGGLHLGSHNGTWLTVIGRLGGLKWVSWINVSSRPHSAVGSQILHNPAESCHCMCTLNESPPIPRLAKVRCDWKARWGDETLYPVQTHAVLYLHLHFTAAYYCRV